MILPSLALSAMVSAVTSTPRGQFDAHRLQTGEFTYRESENGAILGQGSITIRRGDNDDTYYFATQVSGSADQHWESVATATMTPIFAQLTFGQGPDQPTVFKLNYANNHVTGFALHRRSADPKSEVPVNASIDSNTVDQRIDWASVMALDLRKGTRFRFSVYDPITGSSEVRVQVGPRRRIEVPAGTFPVFPITYWVKKSTGAERYIVYATENLPRFMVREDFPDGTISELAKKQ